MPNPFEGPELFEPWNRYPEVTRERLAIVAGLIRDVRQEVSAEHNPAAGDGPWSLGCRAYERTCNRIELASSTYPWLTVTRVNGNPLCLCFSIGLVPFRFYKGEPDDPPNRYLSVTYPELSGRQSALDFGVAIPEDEGTLRLAVETDATGRARAITVVELDNEGQPIRKYEIPDERANVVPLRTRPVETPAPVVLPIDEGESVTQDRLDAVNG